MTYRVWNNETKRFLRTSTYIDSDGNLYKDNDPHGLDMSGKRSISPMLNCTVMRSTGLHDKNGTPIFEGDILEFTDKWEWYRTSYGIKMRFANPEERAELQKQYDAEPMERREIVMPECYEWLLSSEIQTYWAVVGNVYQHPNLMKQ